MSKLVSIGSAVETSTVFNVPFARVGPDAAARIIADRPVGSPFAYVVTPNAAHMTRINERPDARFIAACNNAFLLTMDSAVVRALGRNLFGVDVPRCAGSDITIELFEHHIHPDDPITIIGGSQEMVRRLKARFGLTNVSLHVPPMGYINRPAEVEACIDFVLAHPARYLFIVTGAPRSEYVALELLKRGGASGTALCVGSSLNFLVGLSKRAPVAFRRMGLEWLHRLVFEPKVYVRRIFVESVPLLMTAVKAKLDPAAYGMAPASANAPAKVAVPAARRSARLAAPAQRRRPASTVWGETWAAAYRWRRPQR